MKNTSPFAQHLAEAPFVWLFGGVCYYLLEMLWRGYSHWSMALCGAFCFWLLWRINTDHPQVSLPLRALIGAAAITAVELFFGCILNLWLRLDVWDYSALRFNLYGQICLRYSFLWFLLCFPISTLTRLLQRAVFPADEP